MPSHRSISVAALAALVVLVFASAPAHAERKVYLNGVDLSDVDVRGHEFKRAKVRFDDKGDVFITVKGLKVEKKPVDRTKSTPAPTGEQDTSGVPAPRGRRDRAAARRGASRPGPTGPIEGRWWSGRLARAVW